MFDFSITVVVADDMASIRKVIIKCLNTIGFKNILEATNGQEALDHVINNQPAVALIISDWNMPVMNGLEFLKKVREDSQIKHLPFMMVTSESDKEQILEAINSGVTGYILKPFTSESLFRRLEEASKRLIK